MYHQPEAPRRHWFVRHKILTGLGVLVAVIAVGAVVGGGGDGTSAAAPGANSPAGDAKAAARAGTARDSRSGAGEFRDYVRAHGTPTERDAIIHVTKVQGADEKNDILDTVAIFTDYTGGITGPHAADGKLIASAFADWKNSANGLVTVYDASGEILSNGGF